MVQRELVQQRTCPSERCPALLPLSDSEHPMCCSHHEPLRNNPRSQLQRAMWSRREIPRGWVCKLKTANLPSVLHVVIRIVAYAGNATIKIIIVVCTATVGNESVQIRSSTHFSCLLACSNDPRSHLIRLQVRWGRLLWKLCGEKVLQDMCLY